MNDGEISHRTLLQGSAALAALVALGVPLEGTSRDQHYGGSHAANETGAACTRHAGCRPVCLLQ